MKTALQPGAYHASAFRQVVVLDLLLYAALFWRDFHDPAQMLVAHYLSFVAITDLAVFFVPLHARGWFNWFRASSGVAFLVLVIALHTKGLDGESLALTLLRGGLCVMRTAHAIWQLRCWGPNLAELRSFPGQAEAYYRQGTASQRLGCAYLLVGLGLLYFPHLAYWTHFNGGENRLDDILTGLQAQAGLKLLHQAVRVRGPGHRCRHATGHALGGRVRVYRPVARHARHVLQCAPAGRPTCWSNAMSWRWWWSAGERGAPVNRRIARTKLPTKNGHLGARQNPLWQPFVRHLACHNLL